MPQWVEKVVLSLQVGHAALVQRLLFAKAIRVTAIQVPLVLQQVVCPLSQRIVHSVILRSRREPLLALVHDLISNNLPSNFR